MRSGAFCLCLFCSAVRRRRGLGPPGGRLRTPCARFCLLPEPGCSGCIAPSGDVAYQAPFSLPSTIIVWRCRFSRVRSLACFVAREDSHCGVRKEGGGGVKAVFLVVSDAHALWACSKPALLYGSFGLFDVSMPEGAITGISQ